MNASVETAKPQQEIATASFGRRLRNYLSGRRGWGVLAIAVLGAGLALNWSWLVAIGVAPLLLALAPCAAMCALGLCMSRMGNKSCSSDSPSDTRDAAKSANVSGRKELT